MEVADTGHLAEAEGLNLSQLGVSELSFQVSPLNLGWQAVFIQIFNQNNLQSQEKLRLSHLLWMLALLTLVSVLCILQNMDLVFS